MKRIEKTVFISYRREKGPWALAIYQNLKFHGYDVFFDYLSIGSGDFEQIILENIASRAHFLVLLTPTALDRCSEPGDWLRREIEYAFDMKRNIVPLMMEGFDFGSQTVKAHLTGKLSILGRYNGLSVRLDTFEHDMARLRSDFLNIPLELVVHPSTPEVVVATAKVQQEADAAPPVTENDLVASDWIGEALLATDYDEQIRCYSMAISLNPDYEEAYIGRATARHLSGDPVGAFADFDKAIEINPDHFGIYNNRGNLHAALGNLNEAIADYTETICLNPRYATAYYNRGSVHFDSGNLDEAIEDYNEALRLNPRYADAYNNRGLARAGKGDLDGSIADYNEAQRLDPDHANVYFNRANARAYKDDLDGAIDDYTEALRLNPQDALAWCLRGVARGDKGDLNRAIDDCNEALRLNPQLAEAYDSRGVARLKSGDLDGAIADFDEALRLSPQYEDARRNREIALQLKAERDKNR